MIYDVRGTFSAFPFLIRENIPPLSVCTTQQAIHINTRARAFLSLPPPIFFLSTVLGATVTNQCDHLSAVRALEDSFDICTIGVGKAEPEHVQVVLWVFRNAEARAFWRERVAIATRVSNKSEGGKEKKEKKGEKKKQAKAGHQ